MINCKICQLPFSSAEDHVKHFEISHRVNANSAVTCGFASCTSKVSSLERYQNHMKVFHPELSYAAATSSVQCLTDESDSLLFKCPFLNCKYKSRCKSTLRGHRFWAHPEGEGLDGSETQLNVTVNETSTSNLFLETEDVVPASSVEASVEQQQSVATNKQLMSDNLLKKFVHLGLTLNCAKHVPDTTIQYILDSYSLLIKESLNVTAQELKDEFVGIDPSKYNIVIDKIFSENPIGKLHGPKGPMRSYYMRQKQYSHFFPYLEPEQVKIRPNDFNILCKYHYIPVDKSLKWFLEDDSVFEQYVENKQKRSQLVDNDDLYDIHSGTCFLNHPLFSKDPDALQLILYFDEIDLTNCIGPASGTYKVLHVGYTLGNLHPWNRAKVDPLQLILLAKEPDTSYFGLDLILERLMTDLKALEETGLEIRGQMVKAAVLVVLGDNLSSHVLANINAGFATSKYFCRYCEESRAAWQSRWFKTPQEMAEDSESEDSSSEEDEEVDPEAEREESSEDETVSDEEECSDSDDEPLADNVPLSHLRKKLHENRAPLRTALSFSRCVRELERQPDGVKGVMGDSVLNKLKYFHVIGGTPPCLHHDIHEGFAAYDLWYCIKKLKQKYKFSYTYLNRKIRSFKFEGSDKLDKPPAKFNARRKKVKGTAVQMNVLLRFLPMLLGDKVTNKKDPVWIMILTLIEIVALITSPFVSKSVLGHLDDLIFKYLKLRTTVFKSIPLRPKHHYFEHYRMLLLMFGPLSRCSTMRFESKHKFFKAELRAKKCLINPTLSLTTAHQRMQGGLRIDSLFQRYPIMMDAESFSQLKVDDSVRQCILASFGTEYSSKLLYSQKVVFHNTTYNVGDFVVTSTTTHPKIELHKIQLLVSDGKTSYAIGSRCSAVLEYEMQFYWLEETEETVLTPLDKLKDHSPYSSYSWNNRPVIVLKHLHLKM